MKIRDERTKQLFINYLKKHPDERFMQAVRNFIGVPFLVAYGVPPKEGDTLVTIIILADICKLDVKDCLQEAYNVINKRTGQTVDGTFIKEDKQSL